MACPEPAGAVVAAACQGRPIASRPVGLPAHVLRGGGDPRRPLPIPSRPAVASRLATSRVALLVELLPMNGTTPATARDDASADESGPSIHLFLVTADPLRKIADVLAELAELPPGVRLTVLSGCAHDPEGRSIAGARVLRFPGESTFDMRRRIAELAGRAEWLLLLEDHNRVERSWLSRLRRAVKAAPAEVQVILGGADNCTSIDRWSWANFLMVLGFHWTPRQGEAGEPMFFNVAFRRTLLPAHRMEAGEFEVHAMDTLTEKSVASDFAIDHVQFRRFPEVFFYHWCNGRVTGAAMRRHHPDGWWHVLRHARRVGGTRVRQLATTIRRHPGATDLPAGTLARVAVLSACHAAGAVYGGLVGPGDAARHLE